MADFAALRTELSALVGQADPGVDAKSVAQSILDRWAAAGGSPDDVLVTITTAAYGATWPAKKKTGGAEAPPGFKFVPFEWLQRFTTAVFRGIGVPEDQAAVCTDVLMESDRRGIDSHGIGRLKPIYYDRIKDGILNPVTKMDIVKETETTAVVDANLGMGLYAGPKCMEMAIAKAKKNGLGMVVVRNSTHYGIAGYYTLQAARAGCIGITGTNARPSIAPTHGVEPMLGTNPLTIGLPTDEEFPFVIDCATSVTQRGKIEMWGREHRPTPPGCVISRDGRTRTDTEQILVDLVKGEAALAPLGGIGEDSGGYKGYSYAVVVEILSAALQDNGFMQSLRGVDENGKKAPMPLGHFFIAIDIEAFIQLNRFKEIAGNILRGLRASEKAPGAERIYTAGEKEYIAQCEREAAGGCFIPPSLQKNVTIMREELGLEKDFPDLPWETAANAASS